MQRRDFSLGLLGTGVVAAGLWRCAPAARANPSEPGAVRGASALAAREPRRPIRGICFDLFTLFDPRSVVRVAETFVDKGAAELCEAWRVRQFEYAWLRVSAGRYASFREVTRDALDYAARARQVELSTQAREVLVSAYSRLELWPDTRAALAAWRAAGLRLAPLANYSPDMLDPLLEHAGLGDAFDARISTDAARTFKPDPRAYALGVSTLGFAREELAFAAFGGWDAAGARWFGFPTFWVNRLGLPSEALPPAYDASGPTLAELASFVSGWARS
ncbi:MAG TPA: haloacid dehalogenase type II [Polyangiaceae bacterium]|nr:haloacid dehalogenase type II [Polyangiaceae bacterium]